MVGSGVGVAVGSGVAVGTGCGVAVGAGLGVEVGRGVEVGLGLDVGLAVGLAVAVGWGVAVGSTVGSTVGVSGEAVAAVGSGGGSAVFSGVGVGEMVVAVISDVPSMVGRPGPGVKVGTAQAARNTRAATGNRPRRIPAVKPDPTVRQVFRHRFNIRWIIEALRDADSLLILIAKGGLLNKPAHRLRRVLPIMDTKVETLSGNDDTLPVSIYRSKGGLGYLPWNSGRRFSEKARMPS